MVMVTAVHGDITEQRVDAIVNAANSRMRGGGGVDGAIHRAGGAAILEDCIARFPHGLRAGDAGWTTAGDLPADWVIHTVGPNYGAGEREREVLESCYSRSLAVADELGARSVAFPLISAGIYAWPLNDAIDAAVSTIRRAATRVEDVRVVSFTEDTHRRVAAQVLREFPQTTGDGTIGQLFDRSPSQWGFRGDPYLWRALRAELARLRCRIPVGTRVHVPVCRRGHYRHVAGAQGRADLRRRVRPRPRNVGGRSLAALVEQHRHPDLDRPLRGPARLVKLRQCDPRERPQLSARIVDGMTPSA